VASDSAELHLDTSGDVWNVLRDVFWGRIGQFKNSLTTFVHVKKMAEELWNLGETTFRS